MSFIIIVLLIGFLLAWYLAAHRPKPGRAPAPPKLQFSMEMLEGYSVQVRGITHANRDGSSRQEAIARCALGDEVHFVPQPDNPFDPKAVAICRETGEQIGYVSKEQAPIFLRELAARRIVRATIEEFYNLKGNLGQRGVSLRVEVVHASTETPERYIASPMR